MTGTTQHGLRNTTPWLVGGLTLVLVLVALLAPLPIWAAAPQERRLSITASPEFGSLYTDEELWTMIAYLRTFLFVK